MNFFFGQTQRQVGLAKVSAESAALRDRQDFQLFEKAHRLIEISMLLRDISNVLQDVGPALNSAAAAAQEACEPRASNSVCFVSMSAIADVGARP